MPKQNKKIQHKMKPAEKSGDEFLDDTMPEETEAPARPEADGDDLDGELLDLDEEEDDDLVSGDDEEEDLGY